jgi:hypothetical protein
VLVLKVAESIGDVIVNGRVPCEAPKVVDVVGIAFTISNTSPWLLLSSVAMTSMALGPASKFTFVLKAPVESAVTTLSLTLTVAPGVVVP